MAYAHGHAQAAGRPEGLHAHAPSEALRPSPYDLYIDFQRVQELWGCDSDGRDELLWRCAFQSVEMGLTLLADAARDARPVARPAARIETLGENIVQQVALARRVLVTPLPPHVLTAQPSASQGIRALRSLGPEHRALVGRITDALLLAGLPVPLGIEPCLAELRADLRLPTREVPPGPYLPYARWVQPDRVAAIVLRDEHSVEDRLFATVHQMTECWLRIVLEEFARAEGAVRDGAWDEAAASVERAGHVLEFLGHHIELLHLMVCADYHPLRVALRGASGAQSAAARVATVSAKQLLPPLLRDLEARGLGPLDVLRRPHAHAAEHRYIEAVGTVERRLMAFYFQHFQLARKVLGTRSFGSLGFEVRALADRFLQPMFQELDDARFDHTMLTNLAHGSAAGTIIAAREGAEGPSLAEAFVDTHLARQSVARYFEAIRAMDIEAWLAMWHPQGTMEDPVGSRPHRGLAELRVFFQGVQRTFTKLDVQPGPLALDGARITATWRAQAELYNGRPATFEGTEMFDLAPDGRILAVRVAWDPRTVADQLLMPVVASPARVKGTAGT
ncbi:MAG: nuclear transport factor 2 family protein [Halobacteriales archaeon]|nr:nuclear transport factor 2 family protein [Halobacteriales archaeon]